MTAYPDVAPNKDDWNRCDPSLPNDEVRKIAEPAHAWNTHGHSPADDVDIDAVVARLEAEFESGGDWRPVLEHHELTASEQLTVLRRLGDGVLFEAGRRGVQADWKEYQLARKKAAAEAAIEEATAERQRLQYDPTRFNVMLEETEASMLTVPGKYEVLIHGGAYSRVAVEPPHHMHLIDNTEVKPPSVPLLQMYDKSAMLLRVEQSVCFWMNGDAGPEVIPVPSKIVQLMLHNPEPKAPSILGLVTHPIMTGSGTVLDTEGLHEDARLYLHFGGSRFKGVSSATPDEAATIRRDIRVSLFGEFEFASVLDADVALAVLLTTLLRKAMDMAPGFLINASVQGSGKTTLARMIYLTGTGHDLPVATFIDDNTEQNKAMLAMLMQSQTMVCFDNAPDGFTIRSPILAKVLTAPRFQGRVLGHTKDVSVPTNTTFVITGNNIKADIDLISRLLECRLTPKASRPENRKFAHADVVSYCLKHRERWITDALRMVKGYFDAGCPDADTGGSRFIAWDRLVRQPIIWSGGEDVNKKFEAVRDSSPELGRHTALMYGLECSFGLEKEFRTSEVLAIAKEFRMSEDHRDYALQSCLADEAPVKRWNARNLGLAIGNLEGRSIEGKTVRKDRRHGTNFWSLRKFGETSE